MPATPPMLKTETAEVIETIIPATPEIRIIHEEETFNHDVSPDVTIAATPGQNIPQITEEESENESEDEGHESDTGSTGTAIERKVGTSDIETVVVTQQSVNKDDTSSNSSSDDDNEYTVNYDHQDTTPIEDENIIVAAREDLVEDSSSVHNEEDVRADDTRSSSSSSSDDEDENKKSDQPDSPPPYAAEFQKPEVCQGDQLGCPFHFYISNNMKNLINIRFILYLDSGNQIFGNHIL